MMPKLGDLEIMWIQLIGFLGTILLVIFINFIDNNLEGMLIVILNKTSDTK